MTSMIHACSKGIFKNKFKTYLAFNITQPTKNIVIVHFSSLHDLNW